jgi:hypothetical protein
MHNQSEEWEECMRASDKLSVDYYVCAISLRSGNKQKSKAPALLQFAEHQLHELSLGEVAGAGRVRGTGSRAGCRVGDRARHHLLLQIRHGRDALRAHGFLGARLRDVALLGVAERAAFESKA